jgi:CRISPR-associated endonuclease/helicase Cas3
LLLEDSEVDFSQFFEKVTGHPPFPYQRVFGEATPEDCTLEGPTGVGKSASVVVRWLYRHSQNLPVAKRLVIVEPMRTLVTQLANDAQQWSSASSLNFPVFLLKGGHIDKGYLDHAGRPCIIVATLDQIVSRQLMRGYSCSRWSWPIHFALLHNDCEYFCDETQLHGPAYNTSVRLAKLRRELKTAVKTTVTWSSATLDRGPLIKAGMKDLPRYNVGPEDYAHATLGEKLCRAKSIQAIAGDLVEAVVELHQPGSLTLVIRNRVDAAVRLSQQLRDVHHLPVLLLHGRFREYERSQWQDLKSYRGVIVATQVVEAGVDLDARVLITDICPWSAFVQRLGRLGRNGTYQEAIACWIPVPAWEEGALKPYTVEQCRFTQNTIAKMNNASIEQLIQVSAPAEAASNIKPSESCLRALFNTEPLPNGKDIDIAPLIRDSSQTSVSVAWLNVEPESEYVPSVPEICPVPIKQFQQFGGNCWLQGPFGWKQVPCSLVKPGMMAVLSTEQGGYSAKQGWTGDPVDIPPRIPIEPVPKEDSSSRKNKRVSLAQHSQETRDKMTELLKHVADFDEGLASFLETCALWHDAGKAHPQFGQAIAGDAYPEELLAKGPFKTRGYGRRGFRHEFVSAILARDAGLPFLAQYLVAAHHGRCRVEATPFTWELEAGQYVRGVADGDPMPRFSLAPGTEVANGALSFNRAEFQQHWEDGFEELYGDREIGPFCLAYLEMLVRNADVLASKLHD